MSIEANSVEMMVGKTVDATTSDTDYSLLHGEQADRFFRKVVDQTSGFTGEAQLHQVKGPYYDLPSIDMTKKMAIGVGETQALAGTSDESSVTFAGRRLEPEHARMLVTIARHKLPFVNLEGEQLDQTIQDLLITEFGNGVEEIACKSESGGSNPAGSGTGYLSVLNGFSALADSGNIYDHQGGNITSALFRDLWLSVPEKWRQTYPKDSWRWFLNGSVDVYLQDLMAQRSTVLGDNLMRSPDGMLRMFGIPIVPVQFLQTDLAGTLTQTGSSDEFTEIILARPQNMYIGYRPNMRVHTDMDVEGLKLYVSLWAYFAYQFENISAVAKAVNVKVNTSY